MPHDRTGARPFAPALGERSHISGIPLPRLPALNLALAAVYVLLALAGFPLATMGREVSLLWPATGAAYAALCLFGPALAPGVALGAFVANLINGSPMGAAFGIALGSTLAPLAGSALSRRLVPNPRDLIHSVRGIWTMMLAGAYGGALVSASGGVVALLAAGTLNGGNFVHAWLTWWLGDALGVMIVAPVALAWWYREPLAKGWSHALELAVAATCTVGLTVLAFGDVDLGLPNYYLQLYLVIPFMIWLGLRFPLVTVAVVNLLLAAVVTRLVAAGLGAQLAAGMRPRLEFVHGFLAITSLSALILAAAVSERRRAQEALKRSEERFRSLAQLSSDWYWELDEDFRFSHFEGHTLELAGLRIEDLLGKARWELPFYEMSEEFWAGHRAALEAYRPYHDLVLRWRDPNGMLRHSRTSGEPMFDETGAFAGYRGVGKDVSAEMEAQEAVLLSVQRLRTLIEATPDPVVMKDEQGRWIVANDSALRVSGLEHVAWFGCTDEELTGHAHRRDVPPLPWACGMAAAHAQSEVCRCEKGFRGEDGTERFYDLVCKDLRDRADKPAGTVVLCRDVTHLKQAERVQGQQLEEIRRLNDELEFRVCARTAALEASNRELEAFSYSVSHDLRAPLRALDGFSRVLEEDYEERLDDEGRGYLRRIRRASQRMGELIDDLLNLSRISRAQVKRVRVDVSARVGDVLRELREAEPGREVEVFVASGLVAHADAGLTRVVLENLLRNAWKFTREAQPGRIQIGQEMQKGKYVFFVRDNGVGFDMEHTARLFSPFQRLHRGEHYEGTGIGLAIVQRIVRLHGGDIWAQSAPGQGATFYFTLG